jgi:uncharacterized oxidoreductase
MRASRHRVLITGGAKGIGLALARVFHANGNHVILAGRDAAALANAASELPGAQTVVADLSQASGCRMLIAAAPEISVLVNNAGVQENGLFADASFASVDAEIHTNFVAPLHLIHGYLPALSRHDEAAIVNVTSLLALVPKQSAPVYCASKAALHSFTRSLRWQLEDTAIRVLDVMPPLVDTAMTAGRGRGKIAPELLAAEVWAAYLADRTELRVGKARIAALLARWLPGVAERILRHG